MRTIKRGALRRARQVALGGAVAACMMAGAGSAFAVGGPVILGGDDLTSHGNINLTTGLLEDGWLYMEKSIANISPKVGRPNDNSVAALGSRDAGPLVFSSDAGAAIGRAAGNNGLTVTYYNDEAGIRDFFAKLAAGTVQPRIIWIAGDDASNDLGDGVGDEFQALTDNAQAINNFVNGGGGLMSHGAANVYGFPAHDNGTPADTTDDVTVPRPGWLNAILPGAVAVNGGSSDDLFLTPAGILAFPGLTNDNINAGPWHSHFRGDLGGLEVLAESNCVPRDGGGNGGEGCGNTLLTPGTGAPVVIGGGQVSFTEKPADLGITKAGSPASVVQGGTVTYTMVVTNSGPNPAKAVTVTDTLPAGAVSLGTSPSCSGTTTLSCGLGDMDANTSKTLTVTTRMDQVGTVTNTAKVSSAAPDTNAANDQATATTTVTAPPVAVQTAVTPPRARLVVTKSGPLAATAGQTAKYTIRVRNSSSTAATSVRLADIIPSGMSLAGPVKGASVSSGRITWTIGRLAAGASRTVSVSLRIDRSIGGRRCNTATATASNAGTARDSACTRIRAVAGVVAPAVTG